MENFFIKMRAAEGHIEFYKERQVLWNTLKQNGISELCSDLKTTYDDLLKKWHKKADSNLNFRIDWFKNVRQLSDKFCVNIDNLDTRIIISTVAKYSLKYIQQNQSQRVFVKEPHRGWGLGSQRGMSYCYSCIYLKRALNKKRP